MKPRFTIFTRHDDAAYKAMVGAYYVRKAGGLPVGYVYAFAGIVAVCIALFGIPLRNSAPSYWAARVGIVVLTLLLVRPLRRYNRHRSIQKITKQIVEKARDIGTYVLYDFFEDHFTIICNGEKGDVAYEEITELLDTGEYYQMFIGETICHVLGKDDFKTGTSEEFQDFILRKTGKACEVMEI